MQALTEENHELRMENLGLKEEMERLKHRYDKLKGLYVAAVKKTIETELKLKELNIMSKIATNFAAYFNEISSEDEDIDLKEGEAEELLASNVMPYNAPKQEHFEKIFEQFMIIEPNLNNK